MLISTRDAAALLSCHPTYLEHARLKGEGPPYVKIGRFVRYDTADVQAWIESHKVGA